MVIVFYISGHGFGHASRDSEVIRALWDRRPDLRIVVRSSVPEWLLRMSARGPFELQPCEVDTGVVQIDSLRVDEVETARRAGRFYSNFDQRVVEEAALLRTLNASLVVGDIPPLASAGAARAGLPSVALGNFTWDWIYDAYPEFARLAPSAIETITAAYERTTRALRLPLYGGFEGMPSIVDIPFIARRAGHRRQDTRQILGLDDGEPIVLASFGGYGLNLPYEDIVRKNRLTVLATDSAGQGGPSGGRLRRIANGELAAGNLRYEDLVAAADVVMTKPGYGIVSECIANDVALVYTSRGHFAEYDVMVAEMPRYLRCRFIRNEDLIGGDWSEAVESVLSQSAPASTATNGAEVAADEILKLS